MCGIVGYIGDKQASHVLLEGLSKLEYRGYDSAGIAVRDGDSPAEVVKTMGKIKNLIEKTDNGNSVKGNCGIGHTRWATHGAPSQINAHPHVSGNCTGSGSGIVESEVVGVHNGIIENYQELKAKMERNGYQFYSQTDTEVLIKLVDYYYKKYKVGPIDALAKTIVRVRGSYALAVMFKDYPGKIFVARKDSPMIIGVNDKEVFIASDVPAILNYTRNVYYIGNLEMAELSAGSAVFYNLDGDTVEKELTEIKWDAEAAQKGGFEHFMMKEIHEQPTVVSDTLHKYVDEASKTVNLTEVGLTPEEIKNFSEIYFVACGSAWHVGVQAKYVFEDLAKIPVRVELASEFRYSKAVVNKDALVVIISQSGETADSLAALRISKERGIKTLAIVNVVGSSIAREADYVMYTVAGPEISVATTKAYSCQLICAYLLALEFGKQRGNIESYGSYMEELFSIPEKIEKILDDKERIQWFAAKYANAADVFFIGRGIDYSVCLEGSLKMKEISYIHSEAYAAGELKHGTISLIEDGTLVIGVLTQSDLYEKTLSNLMECKSRGAYLMGVTNYGKYDMEDSVNFSVYVPKVDEHFAGSLAIIPLQLLGYYISVSKGLDVDKPRNLAKSVTVE
ncbi:MAG: glutamine--fructose-6-phosphate transaminase (isomerizing) [Lachnospiraceae bacterium]|nr:glutamine--fructose-6-phosphate transaminase (isomerizing) [Lachnospiraceae bacterium]